jgi:hypothetical protein
MRASLIGGPCEKVAVLGSKISVLAKNSRRLTSKPPVTRALPSGSIVSAICARVWAMFPAVRTDLVAGS